MDAVLYAMFNENNWGTGQLTMINNVKWTGTEVDLIGKFDYDKL